MADSLNPFHEEMDEDDLIENEIEKEAPVEVQPTISEIPLESPSDNGVISLDNVAGKLLKDNFILTALELHTELVESGRELPRLRDFFSNPSNFERLKPPEASSPGLPRTSSCQTFDSLDFARYSDDGDRQENDKVAVLEFELRKAQETIKSLRATLTRTAETELSTPESPADRLEELSGQEHIREYEKRALNFLVNEYMLTNDYKITSVTFAEENENQDFEDWDDVGLNMPKPPDLLHLYRDYAQHTVPTVDRADIAVEVNFDEALVQAKEQQLEEVRMELTLKMGEVEDQLAGVVKENAFLTSQLKHMEREMEVNRLIHMSTPGCSPISTPAKKEQPPHTNDAHTTPPEGAETNGHLSDDSDIRELDDDLDGKTGEPAGAAVDASLDGRDTSTSEDTAEIVTRTEPVDVPGEQTQPPREESDTDIQLQSMAVEVGSELMSEVTTTESQPSVHRPSEDREQPVTQTDSMAKFSWQPSQRTMSEAFQKALLNTAFHVSPDNRIMDEVAKITDSSRENVVLMLGRCLPHIVPNVLLAKREELIPLILCTASLHPDSVQRDQLLNILFNLIKKPDLEQRQMILTGCVAFAQHVGPTRVETELLPQCWEQINHRYAERRLLVAEACGALAPYLPNEIRSSLVLSMLMQMLQDDKMDEVRESVVRSLGLLTGFIDDADRYPKGVGLLQAALNDPSPRVVTTAQNIFLPSFAMWASELGRLETNLIHVFVSKLEDLVQAGQAAAGTSTSVPAVADRNEFVLITQTLTQLIPCLFASVLQSGPYISKLDSQSPHSSAADDDLLSRFAKPRSELMDLSIIIGDRPQTAALLRLYEEYIAEEWYEPWESYIWIAGEFIPQLLNIINALDVSSPLVVNSMAQFFLALCRTFGRTFAMTKVKPKFHTVLNIPEDQLDTQVAAGQTALTKCTVPVYVAGILAAFTLDCDRKQVTTFLQDLLCTLSLCHAPLDSLRAAFSELGTDPDYHELLLSVLWDGVVHTSAHVRTTAAKMFELLIQGVDEGLVSARVIPALVTLASDPEISVRIATVPAFGLIMESVSQREMLDKVHMQFMTFMDDPMYKDQHALYVELIRTFAKVGPNAEPRFRDDFVLPRLAVLAHTNQNNANDTRRLDIATQLLDAYSALSCCFMSDQLVQEAMLPGLRALHRDMVALAPDHAPIVNSMIRELEDKLENSRPADSPRMAVKESKPLLKSPKIGQRVSSESPKENKKSGKRSPRVGEGRKSSPHIHADRGQSGTPGGSPGPGRQGSDDVRSIINKFKGNHPSFSKIFKKS